jgi:uncharacterized membrane-anchored protein YjiN (DUF445 family)
MAVEIITKEDLRNFRIELLNDLKQTLSHHIPEKPKQWLKSQEVRRILKVSPGTLQNLRINGSLQFTKIGGLIYYNYADIEALLETGTKDKASNPLLGKQGQQ